jgi:hypothetical protein
VAPADAAAGTGLGAPQQSRSGIAPQEMFDQSLVLAVSNKHDTVHRRPIVFGIATEI